MVGSPAAGAAKEASGSQQSSQPKKFKRMRYDSSTGRVVEYWEEAVEKKPVLVDKGPSALEPAKEFPFPDGMSVGTFFPSLKDGPFDAIDLANTKIWWLAKDVTPTMTAGVWFQTDVKFRGILQPINDVLRDVFAQETPGLHLSAHLGVTETFSDELVATSFTLRGSIEGINRGFGEFLTFRNAGLQLEVHPNQTKGSDLTSLYSFFGTLNLHIPNSVIPLVLGYTLEPKKDTLDITMMLGDGRKWESVFGVKGLDLEKVTFGTTLIKSDIKKTLEFSIHAKWSLGDVPVELTGHIRKGGSSFRAHIQSLTMDDLRKLFNSLTGSHLEPTEQDIELRDLTLDISEGRIALYGEVLVDGHKVAKAEVLVTVDGIRITGCVGDIGISDGVEVKEAQLELIVGDVNRPPDMGKQADASQSPSKELGQKSRPRGTPVTAVIRGVVQVKTGDADLKFEVAAAFTKLVDGTFAYFVYGQLDCENLSIGKLLGGAMDDGHPMDLQLSSVTLVAASNNKISTQGLNASRFPVSKGIFLCAELKSVPFVGDLCRSSKPEDRFVLQAGYSPSGSLSVNILLPENIRIELSPTVVSGPLVLSIMTQPSLKVEFAAKLWIKPDGQDPLELTLALSANEMQAAGYAQMDGWWENPLGLSPRLKVGDKLRLDVKIDYKQFATTGMPSSLGFQGGFVVDNIDNYLFALSFGTNPKETVMDLKISQLDEGKVINLINAVAQVNIKPSGHELIRFQDVNIYASPMGCIIGNKTFPPGFVVQGKAFILNKKVEIDCRIGKEGLKLKGEIEGFKLGPLTVQGGKRPDGTQSKNAMVDLEITKERQHLEVDGSIALWDLEASVFVLAETMPRPQLEFDFELSWSELLKFKVKGNLVRPEGDDGKALANLDDADFKLQAVMEQNILKEISEAMKKWFQSAQASVHEGIDEAKKKVDEAKAEFERKCTAAQEEVRKAEAAFNAEMETVQSALREKEKDCEREREAKDRWVVEQEKEADEQIRSANAVLDAKKKDFEDDIGEKKRDLSEKQRGGDEAIGGALRDLQDKRISLQRSFGSAVDAVRSARGDVESAERNLREAEDDLSDAEHDLRRANFIMKPYYACKVAVRAVEVIALRCALGAAKFILDGAIWIIEGVAYNIAKTAVDFAEGALWTARALWDGLIAAAKAALDGVEAVHAGIIEIAKAAVTAALEAALKIKQAAAAAYGAMLSAQAAILGVLREAVKKVAEGISFIAFKTALEVLEVAKKDTTWVTIAKGALSAAEAVAQAALAAAVWLSERLCDTLNIRRVELNTTLKKIAEGGAFSIRVVGTVLGQDFDFEATWSPKAVLSFIIGLCEELWGSFIGKAGNMLDEHKSRGGEVSENVIKAGMTRMVALKEATEELELAQNPPPVPDKPVSSFVPLTSDGSWYNMDSNVATTNIAVDGSTLYQLQRDGRFYRLLSASGSQWELLDNNPATKRIVAAGGMLYQLHNNGHIWKHIGPQLNAWQHIDSNPCTIDIIPSGNDIYQLHTTGHIFKYIGVPITGWQKLSDNSATVQVAAAGGNLYQLQSTGLIQKYTGVPLTGWTNLAANPDTVSITACDNDLYGLEKSGRIRQYDGVPMGNWSQLDANSMTKQIAAGVHGLYQLQTGGSIWLYTPQSGWKNISSVTQAQSITAGDSVYQLQNNGYILRYS